MKQLPIVQAIDRGWRHFWHKRDRLVPPPVPRNFLVYEPDLLFVGETAIQEDTSQEISARIDTQVPQDYRDDIPDPMEEPPQFTETPSWWLQ